MSGIFIMSIVSGPGTINCFLNVGGRIQFEERIVHHFGGFNKENLSIIAVYNFLT